MLGRGLAGFMAHDRAPATASWRGLAPSLALSLILHGIVGFSLRPAGFPPPQHAAASAPAHLSVTLATAATPLAVIETAELPAALAPQVEASPPKPSPLVEVPATNATAPAESAPQPALGAAGLSGIVSGPWYYSARYLHRRPTPLRPIRPNYPALFEDTAGQVVLLLFINEQGAVDTHRILKTEPPEIFDDAVVTAFVKERYAPGLITGYPVKSQLLVEVVFEPGSEPRTGILAEPPR